MKILSTEDVMEKLRIASRFALPQCSHHSDSAHFARFDGQNGSILMVDARKMSENMRASTLFDEPLCGSLPLLLAVFPSFTQEHSPVR